MLAKTKSDAYDLRVSIDGKEVEVNPADYIEVTEKTEQWGDRDRAEHDARLFLYARVPGE